MHSSLTLYSVEFIESSLVYTVLNIVQFLFIYFLSFHWVWQVKKWNHTYGFSAFITLRITTLVLHLCLVSGSEVTMFPSALCLSSWPDRTSSTKDSTLSNLAVSFPSRSFKELNSLYRSLRASDRDPILERRYNNVIYLRKMQPQITSLIIYYKCMKNCTADHRTDLP